MQFLVKTLRPIHQFRRVFITVLETPQLLDDFQAGQQGSRRSHKYIALDSPLKQRFVMAQGFDVDRLDEDEHDGNVGLLSHLGHRSNHSPGISASLCGATVSVQPHPSHSKVKGLGLVGILKLLGLFANVLPSMHSTARIGQFDLLVERATDPAVITWNALKILGYLYDHLAQLHALEPAGRKGSSTILGT